MVTKHHLPPLLFFVVACSGGIGMESGRIPDDFIFSSSSNDPIKLGPGQARLNNDLAWQASPTDENIYLQVT